ncbi:8350_t:CDS:2 [Funneliformis caledonium]|uniref:8350_t:CDS:1 n=1 Tax=Funneliformis caledonium TaxID=1117310 RepID=A0A9N9GU16_9GLOM|nr:8350_t:CDS:2 [Funneliformis caledonium]
MSNQWKNYGSTLLATSDDSSDVCDNMIVEHINHKGSNWTAYVNILCIVAGSGTLGIPYAIRQGGWISILLLILSAIMNVYANTKLIECLYHNNVSRRTSITEVAYDAFGNAGSGFVNCFFNATCIGAPIVYLILSGENFKKLFEDNFGIDLGIGTWIFICGGMMCVPYVMLKNMKEASWLSIFGALTTGLVVVVVFIASLMELPNNRDKEHQIIHLRHMPIALATAFFSYGGNVVYPHVEASMEHPKAWPKVLGLATFTITFFYLLIGISAYATYGDDTLSPIYKNLPAGLAVTISVIMISIHVLMALPIYLTAFALEVEDYLSINVATLGKNREFTYRAAIRILTLSFAISIANVVPYFADIMALIGAISQGVLLIFMPIVIWIKLFGWDSINSWKEKLWVIFLLMFSVIVTFTGTILAIYDLYADITDHK